MPIGTCVTHYIGRDDYGRTLCGRRRARVAPWWTKNPATCEACQTVFHFAKEAAAANGRGEHELRLLGYAHEAGNDSAG